MLRWCVTRCTLVEFYAFYVALFRLVDFDWLFPLLSHARTPVGSPVYCTSVYARSFAFVRIVQHHATLILHRYTFTPFRVYVVPLPHGCSTFTTFDYVVPGLIRLIRCYDSHATRLRFAIRLRYTFYVDLHPFTFVGYAVTHTVH